MNLAIIKPLEKKEHKIVWLEINTPKGNFIIAKGHAPMIITLTPNTYLTFEMENGKSVSAIIPRGIAHITRKSVKVILDT
ncbi:hypothetical protein HN446_03605 [bacterium]|jgi:F0F1-type ATP synthase epsilon subunit|nr:hypothetical protein [bacterium]